jgi:hypothetical protein
MGYPDAMSLCYLGLQKLQHRGKEGVGIVAVWGDGKLKSVTWLGLVTDVCQRPHSASIVPQAHHYSAPEVLHHHPASLLGGHSASSAGRKGLEWERKESPTIVSLSLPVVVPLFKIYLMTGLPHGHHVSKYHYLYCPGS